MKYKKVIRQRIKNKRQLLNRHQQDFAAVSVWRQVTRQSFFTHAQKIAFYIAIQGELNPNLIIQTALRLGKQVYLPIIHPSTHTLKFTAYKPNMRMIKNQYDIWEPESKPENRVLPHTLDLVLVPLVAFDPECNRLGMGKGYYDRAFQNLKDCNKPFRLGLAHQCQRINNVPTSEQDVKMHAVATERKIYLPFTK